ncbi:MAG: serine/threonine-protein kinase [Synechococcales bacterium]|nr:serine/threonine-protein kinase [Synechococcales bacterium]
MMQPPRLDDESQSSPPSRGQRGRNTIVTALQQLTHLGPVSRLLTRSSEWWRQGRQKLGPVGFGHLLMGLGTGVGAIATMANVGVVQLLEQQGRTVFFRVRGVVSPPEEIVILAIDEASLAQGEFYSAEPEIYPHMAPLARWPWQRQAYAIAIEKLMQAGARAVAVDLVLDSPSSWGDGDDQVLAEVLETYAGQVVLASSFEEAEIEAGTTTMGPLQQIIEPLPSFRVTDHTSGLISYFKEVDGRIHRYTDDAFDFDQYAAWFPQYADYYALLSETVQPFDQVTLRAAQIDVPQRRGGHIFFYGPDGTFPQFSFWSILDPANWETHLRNQDFRDKIVLIGPTATLFNDLHETPLGRMAGVEIHANAIASRWDGRSLAEALPHPWLRGKLLIVWAIAVGALLSRPQRIRGRFFATLGLMWAWGLVSYTAVWTLQLWLPIAMPMAIAAFGGFAYIIAGLARENLQKFQLRSTLKRYSSSPLIREIINKQDSLQDLIEERTREILGRQLVGRYQVIEVLGSGGFGETYIASDSQRPGHPLCVVKVLRPASNDLRLFELSQRFFNREAETLERLGLHDQIPQLLAYFAEGGDFYLVQEFIEGHPLRQEFLPGQRLSEPTVVEILADLLEVLEFIHSCGVIHRDIKPTNVIRRHRDQRLVLIDFGAVKEIQSQIAEEPLQENTIGIGTRGYMPNEQAAGSPRFNSDLYAVGMIGIQAVTGLPPDRLSEDVRTGEILWQDKANISSELEAILSIMTRYDFNQRYQSASEALEDVRSLQEKYQAAGLLPERGRFEVQTVAVLGEDGDWVEEPTFDPNESTLPWYSTGSPGLGNAPTEGPPSK